MIGSRNPLYEITAFSDGRHACLPFGISMSDLVDITTVGDMWRKYMNTRTGEVHDGAVYAQKMQEAMR